MLHEAALPLPELSWRCNEMKVTVALLGAHSSILLSPGVRDTAM